MFKVGDRVKVTVRIEYIFGDGKLELKFNDGENCSLFYQVMWN